MRWLNLCGFALRPGFGFPGDDFRIEQARRIYAGGLQFPNQVQNEIDWWIFWGRVAGGLNKNQQVDIFQRLSPVLLPRGSKRPRINNSLLREMWRTGASLELLPMQTKTQLGDSLIAQVKKGDMVDTGLWCLSRIGARKLFYGPINQVVPVQTATKWVEALLKIPKSDDAVVAIARRTGDSTRDLSPATIDNIRKRIPENLVPVLEGETEEDLGKVFGEELPSGLVAARRPHVNEDSHYRKLRRKAPLIGDDCAVVPSATGQDFLLKADLSIEGVHFTRDSSPEEIGARAVSRSLSDIAAMGGTPLYCLISMALTSWTDERWIDGFYRGVHKSLRKAKASLAGGDISHADQFMCDVMICGSVAKGKALLRSGAKTGDALYVSGPLGGWRHKPVITPRLEFGRKLVGVATACMDISDGLALDLHRLCRESGVAAELETFRCSKARRSIKRCTTARITNCCTPRRRKQKSRAFESARLPKVNPVLFDTRAKFWNLADTTTLLASQRGDRIDVRGAARRNPDCDQSYGGQDRGDEGECERVPRFYAEKKIGEEPRKSE